MFHREKILDTLNTLHLLEIQASDPELKEILATFREGLEGVSTELPWNEDRVPGWFESNYLGYNISVRHIKMSSSEKFYAWHISDEHHRVLRLSDVSKEYNTFREVENDIIEMIHGLDSQ